MTAFAFLQQKKGKPETPALNSVLKSVLRSVPKHLH